MSARLACDGTDPVGLRSVRKESRLTRLSRGFWGTPGKGVMVSGTQETNLTRLSGDGGETPSSHSR